MGDNLDAKFNLCGVVMTGPVRVFIRLENVFRKEGRNIGNLVFKNLWGNVYESKEEP